MMNIVIPIKIVLKVQFIVFWILLLNIYGYIHLSGDRIMKFFIIGLSVFSLLFAPASEAVLVQDQVGTKS